MDLYNVFKIDACFDEYASYDVLVGGKSKEDILNHFDEIFLPNKVYIDEYIIDEYPNNKIGDIIYEPYFTNMQMKEFKKNDKYWDRIKLVEHIFTDEPYKILDCNAYME